MTVIIVTPNQYSDLRFWVSWGIDPLASSIRRGGSVLREVPMSDCRLFTPALPGCDARHIL
jgi:hypothetical protein